MTRSTKGFSTVGLMGLLIVFSLVAAAGYYVYKSQNDSVSNSTEDTNKKVVVVTGEDGLENTTDQKQYDKFVKVVQEDGTSIVVSPDKIAKDQDQIDILLALRNYCRNSDTDLVGVNYKVFEEDYLFVNKNGRATISAATCTDNSQEGGGARYLLYKNSQGNWYYHLGGQEPPTCDQVDGWGYPIEVVPVCFYNTPNADTRAPR